MYHNPWYQNNTDLFLMWWNVDCAHPRDGFWYFYPCCYRRWLKTCSLLKIGRGCLICLLGGTTPIISPSGSQIGWLMCFHRLRKYKDRFLGGLIVWRKVPFENTSTANWILIRVQNIFTTPLDWCSTTLYIFYSLLMIQVVLGWMMGH